MSRDRTPLVLVLLNDSAAAEARAAELGAAGLSAWVGADRLPRGARVDVVVTDRLRSAVLPADRCGADFVDAAWILLGAADAEADVVLPPDATSRELALACRLSARIARLEQRAQVAGRRRRALSRLARTDPLTGVANRRAWQYELEARWEHAREFQEPLALVALDLDHFKDVNDEHGHVAGDRILQAAARALVANLRGGDVVARLGGDEFALILTNVSPESAPAVVERIRTGVQEALAAESTEPLRASAGYVVYAGEADLDPQALFAAADRALQRAKRQGRDRTVAGAAG